MLKGLQTREKSVLLQSLSISIESGYSSVDYNNKKIYKSVLTWSSLQMIQSPCS